MPAGLIDLLIDDAAVFPPGRAPIEDAVPTHRRIRASALGRYVGPFLIPAARWADLLPLLDDEAPLPIVLICRRDDAVGGPRGSAVGGRSDPPADDRSDSAADDPFDDLATALRGLHPHRGARVVGVEVAVPAGTTDPRATLDALESLVTTHQSVTVEFDGTDPDRALAALAAVRHSGEIAVRGKFRTGGTRPQDCPDVGVLAEVIAAATGRHVPVKFTAGLHHAVTGPHGPGGSIQYGVLNMIAAVRRAAGTDGDAASTPAHRVVDALLEDDPDTLAAQAISLSPAQVRAIRSVFTSFGCCGVTEPLAELTALGVIDPHGRVP